MKTTTPLDLACLEAVKDRIAFLRRDTETRFPEYRSGEWQFLYTVIEDRCTTKGRIDRLIQLGFLEQKPSDGFGPSIRINPLYSRYL